MARQHLGQLDPAPRPTRSSSRSPGFPDVLATSPELIDDLATTTKSAVSNRAVHIPSLGRLSPCPSSYRKNNVDPQPDVDTPAEHQTLLAAAKPRMAEVVREFQEPNPSVAVTLTELRDIALTVKEYRLALEKKSCEASRPWRARLKAMGEHAFAFDPEIAEQLGDVNSTGTLEEEVADTELLLKLVEQHRSALDAAGMSESFAQEGRTLYEEATGRDLAERSRARGPPALRSSLIRSFTARPARGAMPRLQKNGRPLPRPDVRD